LPFVSVIIPVLDDPRLSHCLDALERQTYPPTRYEVLVVDNGSVATPTLDCTTHPHATLLSELSPGSYAARNLGVRRARGSVLAFTDSDCVPQSTWLQAGVQRLRQLPAEVVLAGGIERQPASNGDLSPAELYDATFWLRQQYYAEVHSYGATANLIARATAFQTVGEFDARLRSGGDQDWCLRARRSGFVLHYCPEARVFHPLISNLRGLVAKSARVVGGTGGTPVAAMIGDIIGDARDVVRKYRVFSRHHRRTSAGLNIRMAGLIAFLQAVRSAERLRLVLGGQPRRR
jgi:glycosyltransferase involved in cell wall biosynthesis